VMKPKPLSSLNHLTVPVATVFPPASIVLRTRRLLSKGYERWHCGVGRIAQPDLANVSSSHDQRSASVALRMQVVVEPAERACMVEGSRALLAVVVGAFGGRELDIGVLARQCLDQAWR